MTQRLFFLSSILLLVLPSGCSRVGGGGGGGNGDDAGLAGLDSDGDGVLTDNDLDSGAAMYSRTTSDDSDVEEGSRDSSARILMGDGRWFLDFDLDATYSIGLQIGFDDDNFDLVLDEGDATYRGSQAEVDGFLVMQDSPEGTIVITEGGEESGSGWFDGTIRLEIWTAMEEPTGDEVIIEGFGFKDLAISSAWD